MRMRKRKTRIFHQKKRYHIKRTKSENAVKITATVMAFAAMIFIGYSAVGPVTDYLASRSKVQETTEYVPGEETDVIASETGALTVPLPIQTSAPVSLDSGADTVSAADAPVTAAPDNYIPVTGIEQDSIALAEEAAPGQSRCVMLSESDMADAQSLSAAVDNAAARGYDTVVFPVKTQGGIYNYKTQVPLVSTAETNPVKSDLTAADIADTAKAKGLSAAAYISVLTDNNRYGDYRDGAYRSDDGSTWLDTSPAKGGKPWISPFDETAVKFLCDTVEELADAGFEQIICDDFIFPSFRSSDIELLGSTVADSSERSKALTTLAVKMTNAAAAKGSKVVLCISADSIADGTSELFAPDRLTGCTIAVDYSQSMGICSDITDSFERTTKVFEQMREKCTGLNIIPLIDKELSASDLDSVIVALHSLGFDEYIVY